MPARNNIDAREWWRGATLYQVYPLSFRDADNDGWGDLQGVIEGLDYIASLGVDGIWLCPVHLSAMEDYGYDPIDQKKFNPHLGTESDFDELVRAAHGRGLKIVLDQVWTYTSHLHEWFIESRSSRDNPKADWYLWADAKRDGTEPNNWRSLFGGPGWEWCPSRRQYYMTHFLRGMPHLRAQHPDVQSALLDVGKHWIDKGVDGFRFDVANFLMVDDALRDNPPSEAKDYEFPLWAQRMVYDGSRDESFAFVERIRELLDESGGLYSVAEISSDKPLADALAYCSGNSRFHSSYATQLGSGERPLAKTLGRQLKAKGRTGAWLTHYLSNHDYVRGPTNIFGNKATEVKWQAVLAVLIATRGNLHVYQGDELGLPHAELRRDEVRDPQSIRYYPYGVQRDGARTPFPWKSAAPNLGFNAGTQPWLNASPAHEALARDLQEVDADSTLQVFRRLMALRQGSAALRHGDMHVSAVADRLLIIERRTHGESMKLVVNLDDAPRDASAEAGPAQPALASPDIGFGNGRLRLPGWGFAFLPS